MTATEQNRIVVVGTGPAGLAAALALAQIGEPVTLVGPDPRLDDTRTTALMRPAIEFLDRLGVGDAIRAISAPLVTMRIADGTNRLIRTPTVNFHASEIGEEFFGLNIPNAGLNEALGKAAAAEPRITWRRQFVSRWSTDTGRVEITLDNGDVVTADLAVAADGRKSKGREAAGITVHVKDFHQSALVLNFAHTRHHNFTSTELHTEHGPCTQVPLPGGFRSSLVWMMRSWDAERLMAVDDEELARRLEERQQSFLGRVTVEPGRQLYPLVSMLPNRFAARRIMIVGEAAHMFPPITAQGLNLGIRDVMDVVDVVRRFPDDPGSEAAMRAYDMQRRPDIVARTTAVNLINFSLLSSFLPVQMARGVTLNLLDAVPFLRGIFMREGMYPGSGFASLLPARTRRMAP